jgi:hypothetical protein
MDPHNPAAQKRALLAAPVAEERWLEWVGVFLRELHESADVGSALDAACPPDRCGPDDAAARNWRDAADRAARELAEYDRRPVHMRRGELLSFLIGRFDIPASDGTWPAGEPADPSADGCCEARNLLAWLLPYEWHEQLSPAELLAECDRIGEAVARWAESEGMMP